jgi:hypothetical protein
MLGVGALTPFGPSAQGPRSLEPLDASGRVTYFIADGDPRAGYTPPDRDLATWALQAWARNTGNMVRLEPSREQDALIRLYWGAAEAGLYGEMRPLTVNGRRGAAVYVRPDTDALGRDIADRARADLLFRDTVVYLTCLHELGHAFGLEHTDDIRDIMYSFGYGGDIPAFFNRYRTTVTRREDMSSTSGLSTADAERVRVLYRTR